MPTNTNIQTANVDLKERWVSLLPAVEERHATVSLEALEEMRTGRPTVSASKYGLEVVCGASCETGAN